MDAKPPIGFLYTDVSTGGGTPVDANARVYFIRPELTKILNIYGKMVAAGAWKDYAIDQLRGHAIFSIHRNASEHPLYKIIKEPALSNRQGTWRIVGMDGQILKRGKSLDLLLRYFDSKLIKALN